MGRGDWGSLWRVSVHEFGSQTACALPHNMENGPSEAPCFREFVQMARFLIVVSLFPPRATVGCIWVSPLVLVFNALFCVCRPQMLLRASREARRHGGMAPWFESRAFGIVGVEET
uniref:Uncharacterized protein n=1 Tax=Vitis vinifera TaxID=29760 RepID=A5BRK9_VITVI|nr:hypothetical protein VITISV_002771 [Vitis vinifera]